MVRFQVDDVVISLDTQDAESFTPIVFTGSNDRVQPIKEALFLRGVGVFGVGVGDPAPPIDVWAALRYLATTDRWKFAVVQGQEILDKWTAPKLDRGEVW